MFSSHTSVGFSKGYIGTISNQAPETCSCQLWQGMIWRVTLSLEHVGELVLCRASAFVGRMAVAQDAKLGSSEAFV